MLHHAARASKKALLTRALSPEPTNIWPSSAFTTVLQAAAARAWTRTAARSIRTVPASTSVTLEENYASRNGGPLPGVHSEPDSESQTNVREISA